MPDISGRKGEYMNKRISFLLALVILLSSVACIFNSVSAAAKITIDPSPATIDASTNKYFDAILEGTDEKKVTWTLTGNKHDETIVVPVTDTRCFVSVAKYEDSTKLTLTAALENDTSVMATAEITVNALPMITSVDIDCDLSSVDIETTMKCSEVSQALVNRLSGATLPSGVYIDTSFSYLTKKVGSGYQSLKDSSEYMNEDDEYYLLMNLEDNISKRWANTLPSVTLNGTPVSKVEWFDDTKESVNVYKRVFVEGTEKYQVSIDPSGGKGSMETKYVSYGGTYDIKECTITPPSGMEFEHYYLKSSPGDFLYPGDVLDIYEDIVLYISWKEAESGEVEVTFDVNGIGDPVSGITVPRGITFKEAKRLSNWPKPEEFGYSFDDWYYDKDCEDFTYGDETIDHDMTLYAHWFERVEMINLSLEATPKAGDYSQDYLNVEIDDDMIAVKDTAWVIKDESTYRGFYGTFEDGDTYYLMVTLRIQDTTRIFECNPNTGYLHFDELTLNGRDVSKDLDGFDEAYEKKQVTLYIEVVFGDRPAAPAIKGSNDYGKGVKLTWNQVSGASRYVVYRKDGLNDVAIETTASQSFTDTHVKCGEKYTYFVKALSSSGIASYPSNEVSVTYNPFKDVDPKQSYFKHIAWAYNNGVIKGTTSTTFEPSKDCKRCDLAVMLYRMYGKPSISGMSIPFTDVKSSDYYYSAVVWAYNEGYIKGTSATTFKPKGSITRQDMVVILWRINGSKKVNIENPFTDVDESSYAYKAIMWAYANKITSGTSATTFSPKSNCLRYQLAVFLHKFNDIEHIIE